MINLEQYPFLLTCLPVGLILWFLGLYFQKKPPKNINKWMGYRTRRSMQNQEAWDFAQLFSAGLMVKAGRMLSLLSLIGLLLPGRINWEAQVYLGVIAITLVSIVLFWKTEQALKERFGG